MASFTLTQPQRFPNGTVVGVYLPEFEPPPNRAPTPTSPIASGTVSSNSVTFTGLNDGTRYVAYALVGGEHRYVGFTTETRENPDVEGLTELDFAAANVDGAVNVPSLRTLGPGANQAAQGSALSAEITARGSADTAEATARANADTAHEADTTAIHGIADTSKLMLTGQTQAGTLGAPTPTVMWTFQPRDPAKGPFQWVVGGDTFNSTWDSVMYWGYNVADKGGRVLSAEPSLFWALEQDYNDGSKHVVEHYLAWDFAPGSGSGTLAYTGGLSDQRRPVFFQINRATNVMEQALLRVSTLQLTDWATVSEIPFGSWSKATLSLLGWTGFDTTLNVNAPTGQASVIQMQYGAAANLGIQTIASGQAKLKMNSTDLAYLFSAGGGRVAFFAQDNSTARVLVLGDTQAVPTFAVKADAAQANALIAGLDSSGNVLSKISKGGYFMTRKTTAPADADLVAGELAIWFDPTNGASKFMIKAKQTDGTVKTAAVALA